MRSEGETQDSTCHGMSLHYIKMGARNAEGVREHHFLYHSEESGVFCGTTWQSHLLKYYKKKEKP
jgi:hypothetical protein